MPRLTPIQTHLAVDLDAKARHSLFGDILSELYDNAVRYYTKALNELAYKNIKAQQLNPVDADYILVYKRNHYPIDHPVVDKQRELQGSNYRISYITLHSTIKDEFDQTLTDIKDLFDERQQVSVYISHLISNVGVPGRLWHLVPPGVQNILDRLHPKMAQYDASEVASTLIDPKINVIMNERVLTNMILND